MYDGIYMTPELGGSLSITAMQVWSQSICTELLSSYLYNSRTLLHKKLFTKWPATVMTTQWLCILYYSSHIFWICINIRRGTGSLCLYVVLNLLTYLKSCCLNLYWDKLGWLAGNQLASYGMLNPENSKIFLDKYNISANHIQRFV